MGLPIKQTFLNNSRIVDRGTKNNNLVHENFHLTVNANGEISEFVDNFRFIFKEGWESMNTKIKFTRFVYALGLALHLVQLVV